MHLVIHDASLRKVAFVDNTKQNTLKYIKYEWYRSLETAGSTFTVTIQKKAIQTDNHYEVAYTHLNERSFITFKAKNKTHLFSVMVVTENEETITCECESANLELINEYANPYKASKAMTFVEYCNAMDLLSFTYLTIGLNEVSDKSLTLEWEGQDTKLARLLSLANKFDAEIEFDTRLNADSSIKQFVLNVYHKNDDKHQGVGRIREDVQLVYGKNVKSVTRTIDKTNVVNAIRPTGVKDGNTVVISGLSAWEEKNADGVVEFYQKGEMLYAPISMQMYPSAFTHSTTNDQWIRKDITVDSDDPTVIRAEGIKVLKRLAYPSITYEVDGFFDVDVGDTVKVIDNGFVPKLILKARVIEQYIYDDETNNKTVLGNFTALENRISDDMQARLNELVEQAKPYTLKLATNNGVVFKNQEGETIVTPMLCKGGQPSVASVVWSWTLDGVTTTGMTYTVRGADVADTATLTVSAYIGNDEVATDEVSFVNVFDGAMGIPGKDGVGIKSTSITYSSSPSGTTAPSSGWSTSVPTVLSGQFLWTKTIWTYSDNTTETGYSVARTGTDGAQGTPGPKGKDGKTSYHHWAYSDNADGTGLTLTDNGQRYMGYYTDYTQADSTDKTKYRWADRWAKIDSGGRNYFKNSRSREYIITANTIQDFRTFIYDEFWKNDKRFIKSMVRISLDVTFSPALPQDISTMVHFSASPLYGAPINFKGGTTGRQHFDLVYDLSGATNTYKTDNVFIRFNNSFPLNTKVYIDNANLYISSVREDYRPAVEELDEALDSKADQDKVVYKTDISVTDEGIVHSASKTVNGQTIASMIAQRAEWVEIIAKLLKVKGDMIVDGTIGANKLSVSTLSALAADLGQISGGSLKLLKSVAQGTSVDAWGSFTIPAHKWGLYIDNIGAISSGTPVRKSSSESVASDMPVAVLASGELRFARVNQSDDLKSVLHYGLSDSDNASINFTIESDGTKQLTIRANGQIVNQATNYTGWNSTGVAGVYYKRQGDVVALKMLVTTTANQAYGLGRIPAELVPIPNNGTMMRVTAWNVDQSIGRNLQINGDGTMVLLASNRVDTFNTQVTWII